MDSLVIDFKNDLIIYMLAGKHFKLTIQNQIQKSIKKSFELMIIHFFLQDYSLGNALHYLLIYNIRVNAFLIE